MKNDCIEVALRELEAAGVRGVEQAHGGKHLQLRWRVNGHDLRIYSVPGTPSDVRSPRNVRADIRRLLREDGVLITPEPPAPARTLSRLELLERRIGVQQQTIELMERRIAVLEPAEQT
jgi:hypothetical protein